MRIVEIVGGTHSAKLFRDFLASEKKLGELGNCRTGIIYACADVHFLTSCAAYSVRGDIYKSGHILTFFTVRVRNLLKYTLNKMLQPKVSEL